MTQVAFILVLISTLTHPSWNLLLKLQTKQELAIFWALLSTSAVVLPVGIFLYLRYPIEYPGWWFILGTSILHTGYFFCVSKSYSKIELSLAYPISRGTGPILVPILGVVILHEFVSALAVWGITVVLLGLLTVYWTGSTSGLVKDPLKLLKNSGIKYALGTGLTIAAYSIWDKLAMQYVSPFLYMYLMCVGSSLGLTPILLKTYGAKGVADHGNMNLTQSLFIGILMFISYGLVLTALEISQLSYVWPTRELGTVIGVSMGSLVLKEPFGRDRLTGSAMIATGVILIALAS